MPITTPATVLGGGTYNQQAVHAVAGWLNDGGAEDIWSKATPTWYLLYNAAKRMPLGPVHAVRLLDERATEPTPFKGYQTVGTTATRSGVAATFSPTQYSMPMQMALTDELDFQGPHAIGDWHGEQAQNSVLSLGATLSRDMFRGNELEADRIVGWEQLMPYTTQEEGDGSGPETALERIPAAWIARQATSSYGGITRSRFTADGVGGTGWEPCTANYFNAAANKLRFSSTAPYAPDLGLQTLKDMFSCAAYGPSRVSHVVSTRKPYDDMSDAISTKTTFFRDGERLGGGDVAVDHVMYNGAVWFYDEYAATWSANSSDSDDNIYGFNLNTVGFKVDSRLDMVLTEPRVPYNQHASVKFILLRLMHFCKNPRMGIFRIFNYPVL